MKKPKGRGPLYSNERFMTYPEFRRLFWYLEDTGARSLYPTVFERVANIMDAYQQSPSVLRSGQWFRFGSSMRAASFDSVVKRYVPICDRDYTDDKPIHGVMSRELVTA